MKQLNTRGCLTIIAAICVYQFVICLGFGILSMGCGSVYCSGKIVDSDGVPITNAMIFFVEKHGIIPEGKCQYGLTRSKVFLEPPYPQEEPIPNANINCTSLRKDIGIIRWKCRGIPLKESRLNSRIFRLSKAM